MQVPSLCPRPAAEGRLGHHRPRPPDHRRRRCYRVLARNGMARIHRHWRVEMDIHSTIAELVYWGIILVVVVTSILARVNSPGSAQERKEGAKPTRMPGKRREGTMSSSAGCRRLYRTTWRSSAPKATPQRLRKRWQESGCETKVHRSAYGMPQTSKMSGGKQNNNERPQRLR